MDIESPGYEILFKSAASWRGNPAFHEILNELLHVQNINQREREREDDISKKMTYASDAMAFLFEARRGWCRRYGTRQGQKECRTDFQQQ